MIEIKIKPLRKDFVLPKQSKVGDAGFDVNIYAFKWIKHNKLVDSNYSCVWLQPNERIGCCLGFASDIPPGYYCKLVPRSGLALFEGITIINSPGTIDCGYRNEWMAIILNTSDRNVELKIKDRIGQFIVQKLIETTLVIVEDLEDSERGKGGFGSTGK